MRNRRIIITVLLVMVLLTTMIAGAAEFQVVPSGSLSVQYDDGNGTLFQELPINYARLNHLQLNNAVIISGSGYSIQDAQSGNSDRATKPHLVWSGKVKFGGNKITADTNAVTKENILPPVTVKFPDGATLSDGSDADVIVTLDQISLNLTKSFNTNITDNTNVYVLLAFSDASGFWLDVTSPKTAIDKWDYTSANKSSSAGVATKLRVSMKVTEAAPGNSIGNTVSADDYPSMLIEYKDLDVKDYTIKTSASYTDIFNGTYSEGVELLTGWGNPVVLAPLGDGILNQSLLDKKMVNGNTRIKGKGSQYKALEELTGSANDLSSFYSGFVAPASPAGFSFYWTGSVHGGSGSYMNIATLISGQPTVSVRAKRSEGGSLGNSEIGAYSGLNSFFNNTHLMNSAAVYYFEPEEGWKVDYLKVEGAEVELTDEEKLSGGSYLFTRLNKNPVPERIIQDGNILDATDNGFYEIEIRYVRIPGFTTTKSAEPEFIYTMSDEPVTYTISCRETIDEAAAGSHQVKDDLANGVLSIVPGSLNVEVSDNCTYTVDKNDSEGLWITFNTCEAADSKPEMTINYQATVNWDKYESGSIVNNADGSEAYVKAVNDIELTKNVKGKLRDTTKQFEFTAEIEGLEPDICYEITEGNGGVFTAASTGTKQDGGFMSDQNGKAVLKFSLAGGQNVIIKGLPAGIRYRINESGSNHIPSYIQTSDQNSPLFAATDSSNDRNNTSLSTEWETLDKQDGRVTVSFINSRDPEPVTGIIMTNWFIAFTGIVSLIVIASAACLIRKRKDEGGDA